MNDQVNIIADKIIPVLIFNTKKALPLNKPFFFLPHKLEMHFLEPVSPEGLTSELLKENVFTIMKEYYVQHGN